VAYAYDGPSFYFHSLAEYEAKYQQHKHSKDGLAVYEEYEIQFIDGSTQEMELARAMNLTQSNIEEYYKAIDEETYDDINKFIAASRLSQYNVKVVSDVHSFSELHVGKCSIEEYAKDWLYSMDLPSWVLAYLDAKEVAECEGVLQDVQEMDIDDQTWLVEDRS
jgi:hypothetical protein